jgi:SNF2 family DNA or RNA helicase
VPAHQVLRQLRPRLLVADTVGLGKTLEAGILTAELMRRGKARRMLVVTTKSMMLQFQQEFWNRFTISLTRLDSAGIQRIRREIPANHNPFNYYDRTIISVDTLKRDSEYRHYLEKAWWDLIIIDEAHNVSYKGNRTQSNRLAGLLATTLRCAGAADRHAAQRQARQLRQPDADAGPDGAARRRRLHPRRRGAPLRAALQEGRERADASGLP